MQINFSDKELILTVGLPRSGKSTWARQQDCPIVNLDSIRLALHREAFIPSAEKMVAVIARYMVEALFIAGHNKVVFDSCSMSRKRRDVWKDGGWKIKYVVFKTSYEECIHRVANDAPGREGLLAAITRMHENNELISEEEIEGLEYDDVITVVD